MKQQRDVGQAENPSLSISLSAEADDLVAPGLLAHTRDHRLVDVLACDQIEDHRNKPCVLDPLVATRWIVHGDSRPEDLADSKPTCRRVEAGVEFVDLVGQQTRDRGPKDARKLGVQQMANRAVERLASAGVEGLPRWRW